MLQLVHVRGQKLNPPLQTPVLFQHCMVVAAHSTSSQLGELEWGGGMIRIYASTPLAFKRMKGVSNIKIKTF